MNIESKSMDQTTALSSPTQPRARRNDRPSTATSTSSNSGGMLASSTSNQSFQSSSSRLLRVDSPTAAHPPIALGDISAEMASEIIETRPNSSNSNDSDQSTELPHSSLAKLKSLSQSRGPNSHHPTLSKLNQTTTIEGNSADSSSSPLNSSGIHDDVFHTPTTLTPSNSHSLLTPRIGTHAHAIPPPRSESTVTDSDLDDLSRYSTDDRDSYYDDPNLPLSSTTRFGSSGNVGMIAMDRELGSLAHGNISSNSFGGSKSSTVPKIGGFGVRDDHVPHTEGMRSRASEKAQEQDSNNHQASSNGVTNAHSDRRPSVASNGSSGGGILHLDQNLKTPPKSRRTASASTPPVTPNPNEWASNFWCVITDPMSGQSFFANPETGSCCWEVPAGTFVLPPNPDGQWWELLDEARGLPYFYHTSTKVSTWVRPIGFVIPLTAIQESTLGRRFSKTEFGKDHLSALASTSNADEESRTDSKVASSIPSSVSKRLSQPPAPAHSPSIEQVLAFEKGAASGNSRGFRSQTLGTRDDLMANAMAGSQTRSLGSRTNNALNGASSANAKKIPVVQLEPPSSPPAKNLSRSASNPQSSPRGDDKKRPSPHKTQSYGNERRDRGGSSDHPADLTSSERSLDLSTLSSFEISAPIRRERDPAKRNGPMSLLRTRKVSASGPNKTQKGSKTNSSNDSSNEPGVTRLSTGEHRVLPSPLADEIRKVNFQVFAKANFSPHRAGILRRKTPAHKRSSFQKTPISAPLLPLEKELQKDAVKIFKVILRICGDREAPVHSKLPPLALTSYGTVPDRHVPSSPTSGSPRPTPMRKNSAGLGTPVGAGIQSFSTPTRNHQKESSDDSFSDSRSPPSILEEERWLLERGIIGGPKLRDEIYVQVLKQLSENPRVDSTFRCWQLLCVLLDTFPPTLTFHSYLRDFIEGHANLGDLSSNGKPSKTSGEHDDRDAITAMARHCIGSLARIQRRGARGRAPSLIEIECSSEKAFNPTVFGLKLEEVMEVQQKAYPDAKVPIICTFLTEALLAVGAEREGIFRVAGDSDIITELRVRIERGQYTLADLQGFDADTADAETDVAVLTSLLKLWLRELDSPLIPSDMYQDCLSAAKTPSRAIALIHELPTINKRVLLFIISFLQLFCPPSVVQQTRMSPENIALVWSPNILRNESMELNIAYPNSRLEQSFVKQLLLYLDCQSIDEDYRPPHHVEKEELLEAIREDNDTVNLAKKTNGQSSSSASTVSEGGVKGGHLYGRALSPITDDTESVTTVSTAPTPRRGGLL